MRGDVFTSYIICNRLDLETLFEPIIDFIEIGGIPPLRTIDETFISYSSSKNTQRLVPTEMVETFYFESNIQPSLRV